MQNLCVQDYQGNNRLVVNATTNSTDQVTHYYPNGELMADISTSPDAQPFKYGGKEVDRTDGLDLYDFNARQYDPILGGFTSVDPLAEKYYGISPYAYCAGDPVNLIDPTGCFLVGDNGNKICNMDDLDKYGTVEMKTVATCMSSTAIGTELLQALFDADYPITMLFHSGSYSKTYPEGKENVKEQNPLGLTTVSGIEGGDIQSVKIEFFKSEIDDVACTASTDTPFDNPNDPRSRWAQNINNRESITYEDVLGGTAVHEAVHATNKKANHIGEKEKN